MNKQHSLHQAQSHEVLRSWQSQRNDVNHAIDFVLPMFIGNNDDSREQIPSMPGVFRYGCNEAIKYLQPLVEQYSLQAVLLFPVMTKSDQLKFTARESLRKANTPARIRNHNDDDDDASDQEILSSSTNTNSSHRYSTHSSESISSDDGERLIPVEETPPAQVNSQNPFLNQNEGEEDHLLAADQGASDEQVEMMTTPETPRAKISTGSRTQDVKLIKGMALKEEHNPLLRLIPKLRAQFPQLLIICDVCLCAFTTTGHCCLFDEDHSLGGGPSGTGTNFISSSHQRQKVVWPGETLNQFPISNKVTCQYLAKLSVVYAKSGCNVVAPSDMMDGRILTIREELNKHNFKHVAILSYSAKFASAFYGPFRQATNNAPQFGDRRAYQLPPGSRGMAMKAVQRDIEQGADFVMVKPAGPYLDIVRDICETHPKYQVAVYQVSGEYSMLRAAGDAGVLDLKRAVNEVMTSYRRAGATIIISYFTPEILKGEI